MNIYTIATGILIALKLAGFTAISWWIVFLPIFAYVLVSILWTIVMVALK
jgi:hypothetical protein